MSFYTRPKIDLSAERSEKSVLLVRQYFLMENGFVSREIDGSKDYGVDIYSELVDSDGPVGASFPIQIKSAKRGQIIRKKNGDYISLQFKTSRLGYLCNHIPYYGLIIYYDEYTELLYFDYVWKIYERLMLIKEDGNWKNQETAIIHIPTENTLTKESLQLIYNIFSNISNNHISLIKDKGTEYGLNYIETKSNTSNKKTIDKNKAIEYLEICGRDLINSYKFEQIIQVIENHLCYKDYKDRYLIHFLAAISYTRLGIYIEANISFLRCQKLKSSFHEGLWEILELVKFELDYGLGEYSPEEAIQKLEELKSTVVDVNNIASIDQISSMVQIGEKIGKKEFSIDEVEKLMKVFDTIENNTQSQDHKHFQKVFQSENLTFAITRLHTDFINDERLIDKSVPYPKHREELFNYIKDKIVFIIKINTDAIEHSLKIRNTLLEATAKHNIAKIYFSINYALFINKKEINDKSSFLKLMEDSTKLAIESYNLFLDLSINKEAYLSIRTVYDLYRLTKEYIDTKLDHIIELDEINKIIETFSEYDFYDKFGSTIDEYCVTYSHHQYSDNPLLEQTDEDVEFLAKRYVEIQGLPQSRIINLKNEIISFRIFHQFCNNPDLMLLTNQNKMNHDELWKYPSNYQIINQHTGLIYAEGINVKKMLASIGFDINS